MSFTFVEVAIIVVLLFIIFPIWAGVVSYVVSKQHYLAKISVFGNQVFLYQTKTEDVQNGKTIKRK